VALVTTVALPGMLEALRQGGRDQSEDGEDTDTTALLQTARSAVNLKILRPTSLLREASEEQSECRLVLPLLDGEGNDGDRLQSLCQKTFSNLACRDARNALAERPWSMEAVGEACSHLGSPAGVWRNHDVSMESALLLRQRSSLRSAERDKIRQKLDSSLKRKGQAYVEQPPYTTAVPTTSVGAATSKTFYFGESAAPYNATPNRDFEDATVWCGNSSAVKGQNCTPPIAPPSTSSTQEDSVTTSVAATTTAMATTVATTTVAAMNSTTEQR